MKKKGLIVATIVMVLVLAVSLTTATYAWFTASSAVQVNDITLAITSNAKVNVGVRTSGTSFTSSSYANYHYETLASTSTDNTVAWNTADGSGAVQGMGSVLTFSGLDLGVDKAIGSGTATGSTVTAVDASTFNISKTLVKAQAGATDTAVDSDMTKAAVAIANHDYLHAVIGVEANTTGLKGIYVKVEVATTDQKRILGMNAALHFYITTSAGSIDFEPFGTVAYSSPKSATTASSASSTGGKVTYDSTSGQLTSVFYFWVSTDVTGGENATEFDTNGAEIKDFEIYAFIKGADTDCNSKALGTSCKISISFDGTEDITKLADGETAVSSVTFLTL